MTLFGLTGGVASGKSTVAHRFAARGVPVIDADEVARDVVAPGTEGLAEVVAAFGAGIATPDGHLDRAALGLIVFHDASARRRLEAITHPRIAAGTRDRAAALAANGVALACYEAALLVENGLQDAFRPLVVVAASPDVQRQRLSARDGIDAAEAQRRLDAQLPLAAKIAVADHVIDNGGTIEALKMAADGVLDAIRSWREAST
ncbi:MAG: dephospho-CoA kinase [Myxococcota bacterium]